MTSIIPPDHTLEHPIPNVSEFLQCTDRQSILFALRYIDTERVRLERGLHRLTAENHFLRRGQDVSIPNELLYPLDAERYNRERTEDMDLETVRTLTISLYMMNRTTVQAQHRLRDENEILRKRIQEEGERA